MFKQRHTNAILKSANRVDLQNYIESQNGVFDHFCCSRGRAKRVLI